MANRLLDRDQFHGTYVEAMSMAAVEWSPRVRDPELEKLESAATFDGVSLELDWDNGCVYIDSINRKVNGGKPGSGAVAIRRVQEFARSKGVPVKLWTDGKRLIRYYKGLGFKVAKKRRGDDGGVDADMIWTPDAPR